MHLESNIFLLFLSKNILQFFSNTLKTNLILEILKIAKKRMKLIRFTFLLSNEKK